MTAEAEEVVYRVTLREYVRVLKAVSNGDLDSDRGASKLDRRLLRELLDAGLISELASRSPVGGITFRSPFCITPSGISALSSWEDYLRENGRWQKFLRGAWTVGLVLLGGVAATIPGFLKPGNPPCDQETANGHGQALAHRVEQVPTDSVSPGAITVEKMADGSRVRGIGDQPADNAGDHRQGQ